MKETTDEPRCYDPLMAWGGGVAIIGCILTLVLPYIIAVMIGLVGLFVFIAGNARMLARTAKWWKGQKAQIEQEFLQLLRTGDINQVNLYIDRLPTNRRRGMAETFQHLFAEHHGLVINLPEED
jgi:hypothetical protein